MEQAQLATQVLANLGLLFTGVGVLWFATVYRDKNKKEWYRKLAA